MDKLKLTKTSVEIELEDPPAYYTGGSTLKGSVIFSVNDQKGIDLKEVSVFVICDVDISIGGHQAQDTSHNKNVNKAITQFLRLYSQDQPISAGKLKVGQHRIPFEIKLPTQHPTLPPSVTDIVNKQTFGNVNYYVKVKAKRSTNSWFSKSGLKAKHPFIFIPVQLISEFNPKMDESDFMSFVEFEDSNFSVAGGLLRRIIPTKKKRDNKMALYCTLKVPSQGLRQDQPNQFGLVLRLGDSSQTLMVKWLTLSVETVLSMKADTLVSETVIDKTPILQKMPLLAGNVVDLGPVLKDVNVKQFIVPTFTTPLLCHYHRLRVELAIVRDPHNKQQNASQVVETVPLVVLSPHIMPRESADNLKVTGHDLPTSKTPSPKLPERKPAAPPRPSEQHENFLTSHQPEPATQPYLPIEDSKGMPPPSYEEST